MVSLSLRPTALSSITAAGCRPGFPTIKIFPSEPTILKSGKATKTPTDYNGERTARAIVETALGHLPVVFKRVASKTTNKNTVSLDDFLALEPEQPKALLFSSKSSTAPMFKAAALEFKSRILLGEVKHTDAALVERFGVTQFPTLLVLPKDGEGEAIRLHGTLNRESLVSFLEEHALPAPTKSNGGSSGSGSGAFDPKVPQVTTQAQLDELCLKKTDGLCFLAFLDFDPEYERSVRDHEANLKILANIKKRAYDAGRPVHVLWLKNSEQSMLRESFGVSDMLPSGMLLSPVRSVYRPLVTGFDEANIWEFIEETQLGKGRLFRYSHTPTVA